MIAKDLVPYTTLNLRDHEPPSRHLNRVPDISGNVGRGGVAPGGEVWRRVECVASGGSAWECVGVDAEGMAGLNE